MTYAEALAALHRGLAGSCSPELRASLIADFEDAVRADEQQRTEHLARSIFDQEASRA